MDSIDLRASLETDEDGGMSHYVCHLYEQINSYGVFHGDNPFDFSLPLLLLQLSLLSIITFIIRFILKPLGQPLIVSQILGGVILGPSVLGKNSKFLDKVFPLKGRVLLDTLSVFGMMFFVFVSGIKVDPAIVSRSGKKALAVGMLSFFIPFGFANLAVFVLERISSLDKSFSVILPEMTVMQSMTAFPVITCFLEEFKILNSEIGRLASSSSFICDMCLWVVILIRYTIHMISTKAIKVTVWSFLSFMLYLSFVMYGVRPIALWAIKRTPEGKAVKEGYIFCFIVMLITGAFTAEVIGMSMLIGSMVIGLVIPDGPPVGAALVEKLDCFLSVLFLPPFFANCGLNVDIYSLKKLKNIGVLQLIVLVAFVGKLVGTMLPLLLSRMPFRDAMSLGLIMNSKGILELAVLSNLRRVEILSEECYSALVITVLVITGIVSPIVKVLYDPSKRFVAYKRRTILHSRRNDELRILACVHSQENVPGIIRLLQVSNPTKDSPIHLVVLHLVKLMGRASSLLIAHRHYSDGDDDEHEHEQSPKPTQSGRIFNAFRVFEQHHMNFMTLHCYKGISPYATMHNDVCSLALEKRTIFIIIPYHKRWNSTIISIESSYAYRHLNKSVLDKAPCSVGVLIERGNLMKSRYSFTIPSIYRVAVLFMGGADDREALAYARRMAEDSKVTLTLIRFVASSQAGVMGGTERSKTLDAAILGEMKVKMQGTTGGRIFYQEHPVACGMDVVVVARSIGNSYDLVLVGRRHAQSTIVDQLRTYNERGELGAVGQILSSSDFKGQVSVLVVQQQTKLWGLRDPEDSTHLRRTDLQLKQ